MIQEQTLKRTLLPILTQAERYRLLMKDGVAYGIFVVDARGKVVSWGASAERLFLYPTDEILGKHFSRLFFRPEEVYRGEPEHELRTAEAVGRACADRWYVRKGGTALWCSGVTAPLAASKGSGRFFVKVLRDLTEMKRSNPRAAEVYGAAEGFDKILAIIGCGDVRLDNIGAPPFAEIPRAAVAFDGTECRN
jgi:PAS domain S-box-containing protein